MVKLKWFSGVIVLSAIINLFAIPSSVSAITEVEQSKVSKAVILYIGSSDSYVNTIKTKIDSDNGKVVPIVKNGRTLVPVRFISESLDADVDWDAATSTVKITLGENTAMLQPGKKDMLLNNKKTELDVPAEIIEGRTYLPLRRLVEDVLAKNIFYDRNLIIISEKDNVFDKTADKSLVDDLIYLYGSDKATTHISGGYSHTAAIKKDGTVWVWGESLSGNILTPERVNGLERVIDVSAGGGYTLALKADGTVWSWGENQNGRLGDGTEENSETPVQVKGLKEIKRIAASYGGHCLALKSDGTVWAWGNNSFGQLGDKTKETKLEPVMLDTLPKIGDIAVGHSFSVALDKDGFVWTWGYDRELPQKVGGISNIIDISAGQNHVLVLKSDGTLWTWGDIEGTPVYSGQVKGGTDLTLPVKVEELRGVVAISAQGGHSAALKDDGSVFVWGDLGYDSTISNPLVPYKVDELSGVREIASGSGHLLALKDDGTLWAFGDNGCGQIGDGTAISRRKPSATLFNRDPLLLSEGIDTESEFVYKFDAETEKQLDSVANDILSKYGSNQYQKFIQRDNMEVVNVDNAVDFINAIDSNREIILDTEAVYNITDALNEGAGSEKACLVEGYDGPELVISDVENLIIRSESSELANILVSPSYVDVLNFEDSNNIIIDGINAGHGPEKGYCTGGVFSFAGCKNIYINNSVLFGCGTEGIELSNVDSFVFNNSVIEDCSSDIMTIASSCNILFQNSKFRYTGIFDLINISSSRNILFSLCEISNNEALSGIEGFGYHLFNLNEVEPKLIVKDTVIQDNEVDYMQIYKDDLYFKNATFGNNTFSKGIYEID
ncbi:stalk domain-containing protein [Acetivibrio cellulolyticus]|uniref:stalk domain-containing protein n=1 Tax=Acetivibrio cellulolyticus TaxID=35830 RepID=UPI0001E2D427|nr:stalk domain-containing protein [Acetivibrio cellulolyticus]